MIPPPWLPIPQQARLTRSLAPASRNGAGWVDPCTEVRIVGIALAAAEKNAAFFKNDRRDTSLKFILLIFYIMFLLQKYQKNKSDEIQTAIIFLVAFYSFSSATTQNPYGLIIFSFNVPPRL
jgi:hypothetical protein